MWNVPDTDVVSGQRKGEYIVVGEAGEDKLI